MPRQDRVEQALRQIKELHKLGESSLAQRGQHREAGDTETEAKERNVAPDTLRRARVFAGQEGYSKAELRALCQLCREHGMVLGTTYLFRLLSLPKKMRQRLETETIVNLWSLARLETEIHKRRGTGKHGGRRPHIPDRLEDLYSVLERRCEKWRRWFDALAEQPEKGKRLRLSDLSGEVQAGINVAVEALTDLQGAVAGELQRLRPRRLPRRASDDDA